MAKRKANWSKVITEHGIRVRLFERGGAIYRDVTLGRTVSENGKARTAHDVKSLKHSDRSRAEEQAKALCAKIAEQRLVGLPLLDQVESVARSSRARNHRSGGKVGIVYFLRNPDTGLVKIGHSTELPRRWRNLETASGCTLELVAALDGGVDLEQSLHIEFEEYRRIGEWFELAGRLRIFLEAASRRSNGGSYGRA